jgi:hypothetical protein
MIGSEYICEIHGKYIQEGESKECPVCEYYKYTNFPEEYEWDEEED